MWNTDTIRKQKEGRMRNTDTIRKEREGRMWNPIQLKTEGRQTMEYRYN